jgi:hypothetical protein
MRNKFRGGEALNVRVLAGLLDEANDLVERGLVVGATQRSRWFLL